MYICIEENLLNMKTILQFLALFTLINFSASAQIELHYHGSLAADYYAIDSASGTMTDQLLDHFEKDFYIVNTGTSQIQVEYKRYRVKHTNSWEDQVCDQVTCFTADNVNIWSRPTNSASFNELLIPAGDSSLFQPKIFPRDIEGCIIYTYKLTSTFGVLYDSVQLEANYGNVECILGIDDELSKTTFNIYPNPVNDILNIKVAELNSNSTITIFDIAGKMVLSSTLKNGLNTMNVNSLNSGIYFYAIKQNNEIIETKKLIIQ